MFCNSGKPMSIVITTAGWKTAHFGPYQITFYYGKQHDDKQNSPKHSQNVNISVQLSLIHI